MVLLLAVVTVFFWWFGTYPILWTAGRWSTGRSSATAAPRRSSAGWRRSPESRAAAVDHSAAELRRLERDLHDGTQARLVAVSMSLGMAEELFESDPEAARRTVSEARAATSAAIADLRSVVRGIHPPVLADRGLDGAIRALALDMAVPVEVVGALAGRPPAPIESAVYFAVAECLANSAKHAGHRQAWVELSHERRRAPRGGQRRRARGRGRRLRDRDAGGDAAAGGLRRHDDGVQPRRGAHDRHPGGPVRLVLAEDNALLRAGLTQLLEGSGFVVARAVDNAVELDDALLDPDVDGAVLDVRMPPTFTDEGLRAAIAVRAQRPGFPVLVLSQYVEQLYARELLASGEGAIGYLLKDRVSDVREFVDGVRRVLEGGTVLDPEVVATVMARQRDQPLDRLTAREQEVLALMAEGRSNASIAATLHVTEKAVAKHINSIFAKLDLPVDLEVNRRVQAVLAYLRL